MSNTSKIMLAGMAGTAAFLIVRKIILKNRRIFDEIFFDSEFLPGTSGEYRPLREYAKQLPHHQVFEDSENLFL